MRIHRRLLRWRAYWWVLMIFDSLMAPLSVFSLRTGRTLVKYTLINFPNCWHADVLWRVCRIDDDSFLSLVVCNKVGVVIPRPLPYRRHQQSLQKTIEVFIHIGMDWICMAREVASCFVLASTLPLAPPQGSYSCNWACEEVQ